MSTRKRLYSVHDITTLLNAELEASGAAYRYTEERVRSRLRYLRRKATDAARALPVTPSVLGYDRRATFYTEEDVDKLRAIWTGPLPAESEGLPWDEDEGEGVPGEAAEPGEDVDVREARADDVVAMCALVTRAHVDERAVRGHLATMVSARTRGTCVAVTSDGTLMGWGLGARRGVVPGKRGARQDDGRCPPPCGARLSGASGKFIAGDAPYRGA
jgi:hypothetical protein